MARLKDGLQPPLKLRNPRVVLLTVYLSPFYFKNVEMIKTLAFELSKYFD